MSPRAIHTERQQTLMEKWRSYRSYKRNSRVWIDVWIKHSSVRFRNEHLRFSPRFDNHKTLLSLKNVLTKESLYLKALQSTIQAQNWNGQMVKTASMYTRSTWLSGGIRRHWIKITITISLAIWRQKSMATLFRV